MTFELPVLGEAGALGAWPVEAPPTRGCDSADPRSVAWTL